MAPADQLNRIDVLVRKDPSDTNADGDRYNHWHENVVVPCHFKDHGRHQPLPPCQRLRSPERSASAREIVFAQKVPRAPPRVAPIKSEGEKIPPDEPEPRLRHVAASLQAKSSVSSGAVRRPPSNRS